VELEGVVELDELELDELEPDESEAPLEPFESEELALDSDLVDDDSPPAPDLLLAYRSLYQPPPLRWKAAAVINLLSAPPQDSQDSTGGSLNFCRCSSRAPHSVHW
jgi:hypothetical protein